MTPFELMEPATLAEALALLDPDDPDVRPIAGGTALMLMMKSGLYRPAPRQPARSRAGPDEHRRDPGWRPRDRRHGAAGGD